MKVAAVAVARISRKKFRAKPVIIDQDGNGHAYLNAALPPRANGGIMKCVCPRCTLAYSHLLASPDVLCDECRVELAAAEGHRVQEEYDVELGWVHRDSISERARYGFRDPVHHSMRML